MGQTTIRASSSNSATTGTAVSVAMPTGTIVGDLVVISVHCNGQTTIADNNGATPFTEDINDYKPNTTNGHTVSIFSRRIVSGDPTTYNFTIGASGRWSVVAIAFKNPHPNTIYDVAPSTTNAANHDDSGGSTETAPAITTLSYNAIHVLCGYMDDGSGTAPTAPSGYTQHQAPVNQPQGVATKVISSPRSTSTQIYTFSGVAPRIALSFTIRDFGQSASFYPRSLRPRPFAPGVAR